MKKLLMCALSSFLALSFVSACSKADNKEAGGTAQPSPSAQEKAKPAENIELEFWTINLKKNFQAYIEGLISAYETSHPNIKIKWVDVPGAEVTKKVITALSSDNVPDVVNETVLGLSLLQTYGAVSPMSDLVDKSKLDPFIKGLLSGVTRDGKVMALPWYNGGPFVGFVNSELYQKAGLDAGKPPTTFDELLANGKQIHEKLPAVYGSNNWPRLNTLESEGLPILSQDRKTAVFNSPEHVAFVQKFVDAYKNGSLAPGSTGKDDRQYQQTLTNELVAQEGMTTATVINDWEKNAPALLNKIKVVPAVTGKANVLPIENFQLFLVPKKSKHPKEAADFALYVTSPENQLAFCKLVAIFPSTEQTLKDPFFTNVEVKTLKDAARKVMIDSAPKMSLLSISGMDRSQDLVDLYNEQIRAALMGQKSAKQALDDAVTAWNALLAKM